MSSTLVLDPAPAPMPGTLVLPPGAFVREPPRREPSVPPTALPSAPPPAAPVASPGIALAIAGLALLTLFGVAVAAPQVLVGRSHSWIAPMVLGKSDPRVVEVANAREKQVGERTQLELQKNEVAARLRQTDAALGLEESFRTAFTTTLRGDLAARRVEASRLHDALAAHGAEGDASVTRDLADKLESARRRIRMLETTLTGKGSAPYGALALQREYDRSRVETARLVAEKAALEGALEQVDASIARNAVLRDTLEASPFHVVGGDSVTLGFLPYENVASAKVGAPLASCRVGTLFCTRVGTITALVPGDVRGTIPVSGKEARGQVVRIALTDASARNRPLLFVQAP